MKVALSIASTLAGTVLASTSASTSDSGLRIAAHQNYQYHHFVQDFGVDVPESSEEWLMREAIFVENKMRVIEQNNRYAKGESTWTAAITRFTDRTEAELKSMRGHKDDMGRRARKMRAATKWDTDIKRRNAQDLPDSIDWREQGVVTDPKDQGMCGSCWAFATTETVESHAAINSQGTLLTLSPQQYVNCVENPYKCGGTGGCEGATAEVALNYTAQNGLPLESDVPYKAADEKCDPTVQAAAVVDGYHELPMNDGDALQAAVANVGPVSISVAATMWSLYSGGIFDGVSGKNDYDVNHAVQLVGYGAENGTEYWLVRNSWGLWGEQGYIRVKRETGNEPCGVDPTPEHGVCGEGPCACTDPVTYCGTSSILADSVYPLGAKVVGN